MARHIIQGHNHNGWDTEEVRNMDDVKQYLRQRHFGSITLYRLEDDDIEQWTVPKGLGVRDIEAWELI